MTEEADRWRELQRQFRQLANEEERVPQRKPLRVYVSFDEHPEVLEEGRHGVGHFSLLHVPPHGVWEYFHGVSVDVNARFRALAARAGIALGHPEGTDPEHFWLYQLFFDLRGNDRRALFGASKKGGMILVVCACSATFCVRLERQAIEQSEPNRQNVATEQRGERLRATVNSPNAARRMEAYLKSKGIGQTDFAATVGTTDRTLRTFRKTGKVRRDILQSIARNMGITKETLLKE